MSERKIMEVMYNINRTLNSIESTLESIEYRFTDDLSKLLELIEKQNSILADVKYMLETR